MTYPVHQPVPFRVREFIQPVQAIQAAKIQNIKKIWGGVESLNETKRLHIIIIIHSFVVAFRRRPKKKVKNTTANHLAIKLL